jgi:uncharacterized membrane protein YkvA (DUF1232 family)
LIQTRPPALIRRAGGKIFRSEKMVGRPYTVRSIRQPSFWKLLLQLPKLFRLILRLMKDRRVPLWGKIIFGASVAYVIWPLDLIPALLTPVFGAFDDLAVLLIGIRLLLHMTPTYVLREHIARLE